MTIDTDFEDWLRSRSMSPTPETYAFARMVWEEARRCERDRRRRRIARRMRRARRASYRLEESWTA